MSNLLASVFTGFGAMLVGMFGGGHANVAAVNHPILPPPSAWEASTTPPMNRMMPMMRSAVIGVVGTVNGSTITVAGRQATSTATTTYSVDASSARIIKGVATTTTTISSISVGDHVVVQGPIGSGDTIKATIIIDGRSPMEALGGSSFGQQGSASSMGSFRGGMRNASTTPGRGAMNRMPPGMYSGEQHPGQGNVNPGGPMIPAGGNPDDQGPGGQNGAPMQQ